MRAVGLDLGTTRLKATAIDEAGRAGEVLEIPAPTLLGSGVQREADPELLLERSAGLLAMLPPEASGLPLGIATQRSSFLLWERASGLAATPLVSWQDRRADSWCRQRAAWGPRIRRQTGLLLSPHYAGPKLAAMLFANPLLRRGLESGRLLFGTLDTWLAWRWSGGAEHRSDLSMAARTLLCDPRGGAWGEELCRLFGVPTGVLPRIRPTSGFVTETGGGLLLSASIADQAAAVLAMVGEDPRAALVSLGTGGFVLRGTSREPRPIQGYLCGPLMETAHGERRWAIEGTINGIAEALERCGPGPTVLPDRDPAPDAFALPDSTGAGAPHWRPLASSLFSEEARALGGADRRRVVVEGIAFRVREILEDLFAEGAPERVLLSGGLIAEPALPAALAACLERPVEVADEPEASLMGAARLAAGIDPQVEGTGRVLEPGGPAWLAEKYARWREWLPGALGRAS